MTDWSRFLIGAGDLIMIYEFIGFESYELACEKNISFLGFSPVDTAIALRISNRDLFRAVQDGILDLLRIVNHDGSILLIIPLYSIKNFSFPYLVEGWKSFRKQRQRPRSWQLLMLQADRERGAWTMGFAGGL